MRPSTSGAPKGERAHRACWKEVGVERSCLYRNCGERFIAHQNNNTYCTRRCAQYESQYRLGPDCALCGEKIQWQSGLDPNEPVHVECRRSRWVDGACWKCGREMNTERAKTCTGCIANGRACSKEGCRNHHRARGLCIYHYQDRYGPPLDRLRFSISRRVRREIVERDDGNCQICDLPVDLEAHHLSMWAPALDHIIPVSHMLFADNSKQNLRLTHYTCNASRKDRTDIDHLVAARAHELWAAR